MLKVMIGWMNEESGTVEVTPTGLVYAGPDLKHVDQVVERKRQWYDLAGVLHALGVPRLCARSRIGFRACFGLCLSMKRQDSPRTNQCTTSGARSGMKNAPRHQSKGVSRYGFAASPFTLPLGIGCFRQLGNGSGPLAARPIQHEPGKWTPSKDRASPVLSYQ